MIILKAMLHLTNKVVGFQSCCKMNNSLHHLNNNGCKADGMTVGGKVFVTLFVNQNDKSSDPVPG